MYKYVLIARSVGCLGDWGKKKETGARRPPRGLCYVTTTFTDDTTLAAGS